MEQKNVGIIVLVILIIIVLLFFGSGMFGGEEGEGEQPPGGGPGSPCASNEDCNEGLICVGGICQDNSCGPGGVCPPGFICVEDVCADGSCSSEDPCPPGFVCVGGFCFPDDQIPCEDDGDCPSGQECIDDICQDISISCTLDGDCPPGQECVEGYCEDLVPCEDDGDCPPGQECIEGFCGEEVCIECSSTLECAGEGYGYVCEEGCCESGESDEFICLVPCDSSDPDPCEPGQICEEGCCIASPIFTIPSGPSPWTAQSESHDFCEGCPAEDSIPSMMFLGPNIEEGTTTVTVVAERADKTREVVEDATVFAEVLPNDGAQGYICRLLTDDSGSALFNYSEYPECEEVGCKLKFTFCCANVSDGCLIPICLNNPDIETYDMVDPCDSTVTSWETQASVDGEHMPIYPVIEMLSIPPKPKFLGTAFTMELCLPVLVIFGLLSAAMFTSGRNPFKLFSIYKGRFKRAPQRAMRARGYTANIKGALGSIIGAARMLKMTGGKDLHKGMLLKDKKKSLTKEFRGMKDKAKQGREVGQARKEGRAVRVIGDSSGKGAGGAAEDRAGSSGPQKGAGQQAAYRNLGGNKEMLEMMGTTVGSAMKATFSMIGISAVGKLLTGSGITTWIVYGTASGSFKGLYDKVENRLKMNNAPALAMMVPEVFAMVNFNAEPLGANGKQLFNEDGEALYVASYNDLDAVQPEESTLGGGNKEIPRVEARLITAPEVYALRAKVLGPTIILGSMVGNRIDADMVQAGNVLAKAQQAAAKVGHGKYEVPVGEPISAEQANLTVNDPNPKVSPLDAAVAIVKADKLVTDTGENITDGKKFGDWVNDLGAQASAQARGEGPPLSESDLRLGAEIYHDALAEMGAEGVAKSENLQALGVALVAATGAVESDGTINGEAPTQESADFGLYVNSMISAGAGEADDGTTQRNAMMALGNTHDAAVVLEAQGEGAKTHLTEMLNAFGADGRGEMGDPSRYTDNQKYTQSMNGYLREHQKFMLQNDVDIGNAAFEEYRSANLAIGNYLSTSVYGAPKEGYSSREEQQKAAWNNMADDLDPDRQGRHALQALNPNPGGKKPEPWKMSEKNYNYRMEKAQEYLVSQQLPRGYKDLLAKLSENAHSTARKTGVNPDGTPLAGAPNITRDYIESEAQKIYADGGQVVDFAAARERAAKEMEPLKQGYGKPRDDIALKSREAAYNNMEKTMDAQKPGLVNYSRKDAEHDLHLAFGANPQLPKTIPASMKKEFEEVRKVEQANRERHKLENLAAQRRKDQLHSSLEASAAISPSMKAPTDEQRQKSEEKYRKAKENVDKQLADMRKAQKERDSLMKKRQEEYNKRHYGTATPATRQSVRKREAEAKRIGEEAAKTAVDAQKKRVAEARKKGAEFRKKSEERRKEFEAKRKAAEEEQKKKKK